jgi:hypothetical protein
VPECNHFFSPARSFWAGPLIPAESAASLSLISLPAFPERLVRYLHPVTASAVKKNEMGVGQAEKGTSAVGQKLLLFPFLSRSASDTKEIL